MDGLLKFKCECCGQMIDQWPALTYKAPSPYLSLTEEERETMGILGSDFCQIEYPKQTDRFIRVVMALKVNDHCINLEYGLWVSLSEKSFDDYWDNFENQNHEASYFGYISNYLPDYEDMMFIPVTVITKTGGLRPEIYPHEDFEHPFVHDYYHGISKTEAERRIRELFLNNLPKN